MIRILLVLFLVLGSSLPARGINKVTEADVAMHFHSGKFKQSPIVQIDGKPFLFFVKALKNGSFILIGSSFDEMRTLKRISLIFPRDTTDEQLYPVLKNISSFLLGQKRSGELGFIFKDVVKRNIILPQDFCLAGNELAGRIAEIDPNSMIIIIEPYYKHE